MFVIPVITLLISTTFALPAVIRAGCQIRLDGSGVPIGLFLTIYDFIVGR